MKTRTTTTTTSNKQHLTLKFILTKSACELFQICHRLHLTNHPGDPCWVCATLNSRIARLIKVNFISTFLFFLSLDRHSLFPFLFVSHFNYPTIQSRSLSLPPFTSIQPNLRPQNSDFFLLNGFAHSEVNWGVWAIDQIVRSLVRSFNRVQSLTKISIVSYIDTQNDSHTQFN